MPQFSNQKPGQIAVHTLGMTGMIIFTVGRPLTSALAPLSAKMSCVPTDDGDSIMLKAIGDVVIDDTSNLGLREVVLALSSMDCVQHIMIAGQHELTVEVDDTANNSNDVIQTFRLALSDFGYAETTELDMREFADFHNQYRNSGSVSDDGVLRVLEKQYVNKLGGHNED